MSHTWLQHYPANVNSEIEIPSDLDIAGKIEATCRQYAHRVALTCMGADISFRQFDRLGSDFAAFLQKKVGFEERRKSRNHAS